MGEMEIKTYGMWGFPTPQKRAIQKIYEPLDRYIIALML